MKRFSKGILILVFIFSFFTLTVFSPSHALSAVNAKFDVNKMGDMSDFDPEHPAVTSGDTIKIAIVASFSGPAAVVGQIYYACVLWAAHDINKRGGHHGGRQEKADPGHQGRPHVQAGPMQKDL